MAVTRRKENENGVNDFSNQEKTPAKSKWEAVRLVIWDPSTKEFFGRDFSNWVKLLIFYIIFYIILSALFAICMVGLLATISHDKPTYTTDRSIIGVNPGLGFRPFGDAADDTIIKYGFSNSSQQKYINLMNTFFKDYSSHNPNIAPNCDFGDVPEDGRACPVDTKQFMECNPPTYGYSNTSSPCIFLKLNRIYNWVPWCYNDSSNLPSGMPSTLVEEIKLQQAKNKSDQVWVSCSGEYPADKEHIGDFKYFPSPGFPSYYFPYRHKKNNYLSPIIAVQIINPKVGVQINIECRAWAKNIDYEGGLAEHRKGSVRLELLREE